MLSLGFLGLFIYLFIYFYLFLFLWACWSLILPFQPTELVFLFFFTIFLFSPSLLLGPLSKMDINIELQGFGEQIILLDYYIHVISSILRVMISGNINKKLYSK